MSVRVTERTAGVTWADGVPCLFDAGDYLAALARFESAYAKVPSPKLFFNFGQDPARREPARRDTRRKRPSARAAGAPSESERSKRDELVNDL